PGHIAVGVTTLAAVAANTGYSYTGKLVGNGGNRSDIRLLSHGRTRNAVIALRGVPANGVASSKGEAYPQATTVAATAAGRTLPHGGHDIFIACGDGHGDGATTPTRRSRIDPGEIIRHKYG